MSNVVEIVFDALPCSCAVKKGYSFRSIHAAVAAARDGDQIMLKKGIHNGLGCGSGQLVSLPSAYAVMLWIDSSMHEMQVIA